MSGFGNGGHGAKKCSPGVRGSAPTERFVLGSSRQCGDRTLRSGSPGGRRISWSWGSTTSTVPWSPGATHSSNPCSDEMAYVSIKDLKVCGDRYEAAIEGVRAAAEAKDIAIEVSGQHAASIVLGDFDRMQQVLWNLFFNAVKFTPRGGRVTVWTGRVETHVHLTVTDTGQGIGAPFLAHVFERFRQEAGQPSHTQAGLGLGLTLVRELVELHGGTVKAGGRPSPSSSPSPPCCVSR